MMGRMKFNAEQCVGCYSVPHGMPRTPTTMRGRFNARSFRGISKVMDEEKGLSYEDLYRGAHK